MSFMNIQISRRPVIFVLALATMILSGMGIAVEIVGNRQDGDGWLFLFDLDREWNVPTIFSALLLFGASVLLAAIAAECRRNLYPSVRYWIALAAIFFFFGLDELFGIHNSTKWLVPESVGHIAAFKFRWVVPGIIATLILVGSFLRFVFSLPWRARLGIIIAGFVYVTGALGFEILGSIQAARHTKDNWTYSGLMVAEETLEMVGAVAFLSVLLAYIDRELGGRARLGNLVVATRQVAIAPRQNPAPLPQPITRF